MCNALASLDDFSMERMDNDKLRRFHDFLENPEYQKFFVWVEMESLQILTSFAAAPLFYESGLKAEDYQVAFFIKRCEAEAIVAPKIEK